MATESDNLNAGAVGTMITVLALAVLATSLVLTALVRGESDADAMADTPTSELLAARQSQVDELNQPAAWIDKAQGHVSVPVEKAMELTVGSLKADPQSATPYPPEEPDAGADAGADADAAGDAAAQVEDAGGATPDAAAPEEVPAPEAPAPPAPKPPVPAPPVPKPSAPEKAPPAPPPIDDVP